MTLSTLKFFPLQQKLVPSGLQLTDVLRKNLNVFLIKNLDGTWCKFDEEKTDIFHSNLEQDFQPHYDINDSQNTLKTP